MIISNLQNFEERQNAIIVNIEDHTTITTIIDQKINSVDDLSDLEKWISNDYKLLISGHLHQGIIYSANNYDNKEIIYLGVPSLSKINLNKAIAYILELDKDKINVSVLSTDSSLKIIEIENIDLNQNNKVLKKTY